MSKKDSANKILQKRNVSEWNSFVRQQSKKRIEITDVVIRNKILDEANFLNVDFKRAVFLNCTFDRAIFSNSVLLDVRFYHCSLINVHWNSGTLANCRFYHSDLRGSSLWDVTLEHIDFNNCDLSDLDFANSLVNKLFLKDCVLLSTILTFDTYSASKDNTIFYSRD
jgi:uncharacterized protein YjbI with pentapeptide repeats